MLHFRPLISNALRRRQFYKDAIRVENISLSVDNENSWLGDWTMWDPISSGEGDLVLEKELTVAYPCNLKMVASISGMKKIEEQPEALQCCRTPDYLSSQPPAADGVLQSCGPRKCEASVHTGQLPEHKHAEAVIASEISSPRPTPSTLPSPSPSSPLRSQSYPVADQVPVHENATTGLMSKGISF